jgi:hypothetical protein
MFILSICFDFLSIHSIRCQRVVISSRRARVPTKLACNLASLCTPPTIRKNDALDKQKLLAFVSKLG